MENQSKLDSNLRTSHSQKNLLYSYIKKSVFKLPKIKHNYSGIPLSRTLKGDGKSVRVSECPS